MHMSNPVRPVDYSVDIVQKGYVLQLVAQARIPRDAARAGGSSLCASPTAGSVAMLLVTSPVAWSPAPMGSRGRRRRQARSARGTGRHRRRRMRTWQGQDKADETSIVVRKRRAKSPDWCRNAWAAGSAPASKASGPRRLQRGPAGHEKRWKAPPLTPRAHFHQQDEASGDSK